MLWRADHDVETTDWRAVCGRTARTVRRAGRVKALPDPYQNSNSASGRLFPDSLVIAAAPVLNLKIHEVHPGAAEGINITPAIKHLNQCHPLVA